MTVREFGRELVYPFTEPGVLIATATFTLLWALAMAAGLLGIWLAALVAIAFVKYLLDVLRARALGNRPGVPGIAEFNPAEQPWKLFPLVFVVALIALASLAADYLGPLAGLISAGIGLAVFPLLTAAVAIEQRPAAALDARLLVGLFNRLGAGYLWIPAGLVIGVTAARVATALGGPSLLVSVFNNLTLVLAFSLTGRVLYHARDEIGLEVRHAPELTIAKRRAAQSRDRQGYVDRAYAAFSRGNVAAGIAELKALLASEDDATDCYDWLFATLDDWSDKTARQLFAPRYLERLLRDGRDGDALVTAADCLRGNPPLDLPPALEAALGVLAERNGNVRLAEALARRDGRAD